ncbi:MAG: VWA domain-containing protein [Deltaproteobacteria bacterium]|nr:VWA domain-containing protein [Deltaproteobacteria bacterium]
MREVHPVDVVVRHPRVVELGRNAQEQWRVDQFANDLARWLFGEARETLAPLARVVTVVASRELRDPRRLCRDRSLMAVEAAARATESLWPLLRGELEEEQEEEEEEEQQREQGEDEGAPMPADGAGAAGDSEDEDEAPEEADSGGTGAGAGGDGDAEPDDDAEAEDEAEGDAETEGDAEAEDDAEGAGEAEGGEPGEEDRDDPSAEDEAPEEEVPLPSTEDLLAAIAEEDMLDDPELANLAERLREAMGGEASDTMELGAAAGQSLAPAAEAALSGALESDRAARMLEHFVPGVGWSFAPSQLHASLLENLDKLTLLIQQLENLDALADLLGRMEDPSDDDDLPLGGSEEVVGIRLGGDVANALPSELALLSDPETEDLFYQRLIEHRLISLELEGAGMDGVGGWERRGPIIACIDTSGSMEGWAEMAAKALVLALCRRVLPQGRPVHLILFSGPRDQVELRLRKGLGGLEELLGFLSLGFHGGTDFDRPLTRAMELLEERELLRADVLVVTDGLARAGPGMVEAVQEAREGRGVRVWSVILGDDTYGVRAFSDQIWILDPERAAHAAGLLDRIESQRYR